MGILTVVLAGIVAGNVAALLLGGYSLGALGNSIAGLTGALFLSGYTSQLFSLSAYPSQVCAGLAGAMVILLAFRMAESTVVRKIRLY